jgi:hypothetical protein
MSCDQFLLARDMRSDAAVRPIVSGVTAFSWLNHGEHHFQHRGAFGPTARLANALAEKLRQAD